MEKVLLITKEEATVLLSLLDEANKAKGLIVAESCLYFAKKIDNLFKEENEHINK